MRTASSQFSPHAHALCRAHDALGVFLEKKTFADEPAGRGRYRPPAVARARVPLRDRRPRIVRRLPLRPRRRKWDGAPLQAGERSGALPCRPDVPPEAPRPGVAALCARFPLGRSGLRRAPGNFPRPGKERNRRTAK
jgi:hypothetical protein